jgi:hypothetical protein
VVSVLSKSGLLTRQFLEFAFGGFGAATLKTGATTRELLSDVLNGGPGIGAPRAVKGEVDDAKVHTRHVLDADPIRARNVAHAGKIPLASHQHQIDLTLAVGEQDTLTLVADERNLLATAERPDTHLVVRNEPVDAVVVGLRGELAKADETLALIGRLRRMGVGNLASTADDCLCRQAELFADGTLKQFLQVALAGLASVQATLGNFVAGGVAPLKHVVQRLRLVRRRLKLDGGNKLHSASVDLFSICSNPQIRGRRPPPTVKSRGLPARKIM